LGFLVLYILLNISLSCSLVETLEALHSFTCNLQNLVFSQFPNPFFLDWVARDVIRSFV